MEYLSPVINRVHNHLDNYVTVRLGHTLYSLAPKKATDLDFDMASVAVGSEKNDLFSAVESGYISVDVCVLVDGEYVKAGEYGMAKKKVVVAPAVKAVEPVKSEDIAKSRGITVKTNDVPEGSCNEVKQEAAPKADPLEARKNPDYRKNMRAKTAKEETPVQEVKPAEEAPVLDTVKNNEDAE